MNVKRLRREGQRRRRALGKRDACAPVAAFPVIASVADSGARSNAETC